MNEYEFAKFFIRYEYFILKFSVYENKDFNLLYYLSDDCLHIQMYVFSMNKSVIMFVCDCQFKKKEKREYQYHKR